MKDKCLDFCRVRSIAIFLIIMIGALFVRLHGLGEYDFNDDELWHLVVSSQNNLFDLLKFNFENEVHPPLSFIIWYFALKISHNDLWLRMIGIIPALALIPSIYVFGRNYIGRTAGHFLALLFAFGAMPVGISETIRAYSMMMLAVTWAAIFADKFRRKKNNKNLIYYFLSCLIAIQLNHAALFTVSALGLILVLDAIRDKNKKEFFVISAMHVVIVMMVGSYAFVLQKIYGFQGIPAIFSTGDIINYLMNYMTLFMWFPIGAEVNDAVTQIITLFSILSFVLVPIALIKSKRWVLLILLFAPIFAVSISDYFRLYPFTGLQRNNLFLLFSVAITYGYFVQICFNFFVRFYREEMSYEKKNRIALLQILAISAFVCLACVYVINRNSFRDIQPNCAEFSIKKSDRELLANKLDETNSATNVFVTLVRNIWQLRFQYGDEGNLQILTKNLGKFESAGKVFYFTAIPARERSITENLNEYKLFFTDLFEQLRLEGKLDKIKQFTFFDIGANIDYLTRRFHPQFIPQEKNPFMNERDKTHYKIWQEGYNIGWAINNSKEVTDRFYFKDTKFVCGREVVVFSFTKKFVQNEILDKEFVDARQFEKEVYLNDR